MINLNGRLVNPAHVVSAQVVTRHYMNGSDSQLVVKLDDGSRITVDHGYGVDVWKLHDAIARG